MCRMKEVSVSVGCKLWSLVFCPTLWSTYRLRYNFLTLLFADFLGLDFSPSFKLLFNSVDLTHQSLNKKTYTLV